MAPLDIVLIAAAVFSLCYLPFRLASLVTWLLFDRRGPQADPLANTAVNLPLVPEPSRRRAPSAAGQQVTPASAIEVLDVAGLLDYLALRSAGEDERLLAQLYGATGCRNDCL